MRIGIFASGEDAGARAVYKALARIRGVSCCLFDLSRGPAKAEVHSNGLVVEGEDLALLDLAYVRGFAHAVPLAPDPGPDRDWTVWQADWPIRVQRQGFWMSAFMELSRRGVAVVNPPETLVAAFPRPLLLARLSARGVPVPPMLVTNREEHARRFMARASSPPAFRTTSGRAAWQALSGVWMRELFRPGAPPVWLAEPRPGPHLRAFLYQGRPLLVLSHRAPSPAPPERLETVFEVRDPALAETFRLIHQASAMPFSLAHLVRQDGRAWVYDLDPDPCFSWLPAPYQARLVRALALSLAGLPVPDRPLLPPAPRPSLAVSRMLADLFAFERAKQGE